MMLACGSLRWKTSISGKYLSSISLQPEIGEAEESPSVTAGKFICIYVLVLLVQCPSLTALIQVEQRVTDAGVFSSQFWKEKLNMAFFKHLIAGGVAGAVSRTVVSPLERMKILFQVQGPEPAAYRGVVSTLVQMWREEGVRGYLRGNGTNVIRIVPYSASQFASYEQFKRVCSLFSGFFSLPLNSKTPIIPL